MEIGPTTRLILYETPWCPYCLRVRSVVRELGIAIEGRDVRDLQHRAELVEARGLGTVPVLRLLGPDRDDWVPESAEIIVLLRAIAERQGR